MRCSPCQRRIVQCVTCDVSNVGAQIAQQAGIVEHCRFFSAFGTVTNEFHEFAFFSLVVVARHERAGDIFVLIGTLQGHPLIQTANFFAE